MSFASPLPAFHATLPAALPALGATFAATFAPAVAPFVFLLAMSYLHPGGVFFSNHRDTPNGTFGNGQRRDRLHHPQLVRHGSDPRDLARQLPDLLPVPSATNASVQRHHKLARAYVDPRYSPPVSVEGSANQAGEQRIVGGRTGFGTFPRRYPSPYNLGTRVSLLSRILRSLSGSSNSASRANRNSPEAAASTRAARSCRSEGENPCSSRSFSRSKSLTRRAKETKMLQGSGQGISPSPLSMPSGVSSSTSQRVFLRHTASSQQALAASRTPRSES